jgi:hypothetical protein
MYGNIIMNPFVHEIYVGYYPIIDKNEIMSCARKWLELEIIMLSEISEVQIVKHDMFWFIIRN